MSGKPKQASIKSLIRQEPSLADLFYADHAKNSADDRSLAIVQTSYVERTLEDVILLHMVRLNKDEFNGLFDGAGPLSSFSAKTKVAYALGYIGKNTRAELDRIRAIRNVFAHSRLNLRFDTPEIRSECEKLKTAARMRQPDVWKRAGLPWPPRAPRELFHYATLGLQSALAMVRLAEEYDISEMSKMYPPLD